MDRKEAVLRIKNHMEHHGIGKYPHLKLKEALDMAIAALSPPNEPLTCEGCYWQTHGSIGKCFDCVREKSDNYYHRPPEGEKK